MDKLLHTRVKFEPPHLKRDVLQCTRCQRVNHTKNYCHYTPRCVKCAGEHLTSTCKKTEKVNNDVKCVNCTGNHPANYRGCTYIKNLQKLKYPPLRPKETLQPHQQNQNIPTFFPRQYTAAGQRDLRTYAQATAVPNAQPIHDASQTHPQHELPNQSNLEKMMAKLLERMDTMLNLLTTVISKLA